jgi:hypothetical protein
VSEPIPTLQQPQPQPTPKPEVHNTTVVKRSPKAYLIAAIAAVLLFVIGIFVGLGISTLGHHHEGRFENGRPGIEQPQWRGNYPGSDRGNPQGNQNRQFGQKESQEGQQSQRQEPDTQNQSSKSPTSESTTK